MPDGHSMPRHIDHTQAAMDLEAAIALLEAGKAPADLVVDLGDGRTAMADGPLGVQGLLQRLRGHRLLVALSADNTDLPISSSEEVPSVSEPVRELLDVVRKSR